MRRLLSESVEVSSLSWYDTIHDISRRNLSCVCLVTSNGGCILARDPFTSIFLIVFPVSSLRLIAAFLVLFEYSMSFNLQEIQLQDCQMHFL